MGRFEDSHDGMRGVRERQPDLPHAKRVARQLEAALAAPETLWAYARGVSEGCTPV